MALLESGEVAPARQEATGLDEARGRQAMGSRVKNTASKRLGKGRSCKVGGKEVTLGEKDTGTGT